MHRFKVKKSKDNKFTPLDILEGLGINDSKDCAFLLLTWCGLSGSTAYRLLFDTKANERSISVLAGRIFSTYNYKRGLLYLNDASVRGYLNLKFKENRKKYDPDDYENSGY